MQSDFYRLMTDLSATSLKIEQDVIKGTARVVFDRNGRRYVFDGAKFKDSTDNLRAIYHTIRYLYKALDEYGVVKEEHDFDAMFDQIFTGFLATPDDTALLLSDGRSPWYEILGVEQKASREAIVSAFRALSKVHHPDAGGSSEDFRRLRKAYDDGMAQLKRGA
jgi:hypothetical protein